MPRGKVKWFSDQKGFGFIIPDEGGEELFVHHSAIIGQTGRRTLSESQKVEYETAPSDKGPKAVKVRVV